jgi:hypothetical protein
MNRHWHKGSSIRLNVDPRLHREQGVEGDDCRAAYFSPSWTAFQADRGLDFSVIVDGVSG